MGNTGNHENAFLILSASRVIELSEYLSRGWPGLESEGETLVSCSLASWHFKEDIVLFSKRLSVRQASLNIASTLVDGTLIALLTLFMGASALPSVLAYTAAVLANLQLQEWFPVNPRGKPRRKSRVIQICAFGSVLAAVLATSAVWLSFRAISFYPAITQTVVIVICLMVLAVRHYASFDGQARWVSARADEKLVNCRRPIDASRDQELLAITPRQIRNPSSALGPDIVVLAAERAARTRPIQPLQMSETVSGMANVYQWQPRVRLPSLQQPDNGVSAGGDDE